MVFLKKFMLTGSNTPARFCFFVEVAFLPVTVLSICNPTPCERKIWVHERKRVLFLHYSKSSKVFSKFLLLFKNSNIKVLPKKHYCSSTDNKSYAAFSTFRTLPFLYVIFFLMPARQSSKSALNLKLKLILYGIRILGRPADGSFIIARVVIGMTDLFKYFIQWKVKRLL